MNNKIEIGIAHKNKRNKMKKMGTNQKDANHETLVVEIGKERNEKYNEMIDK